MTVADARSIHRFAQRLIVEVRPAHGSPPTYEEDWQPVIAAKVDRIEINRDAKPSTAAIWFPDLRWDADTNLRWGDMIRIRTDEFHEADRTILFVGFYTARLPAFSGGSTW